MLIQNHSLLSRCAVLISAACTLLTLGAQAQVAATYNTATDVPVTAASYSATGVVNFTLNFAPPVGTQLMVVNNTGLPFISGTFSNLAQGQSVTLTHNSKNYDFVADYYGGSGNDLVLVWKKNRLVVAGRGAPQAGVSPPAGQSDTITIMRDVGAAGGQLEGKTILQVAGSILTTVALCSDGTLLSWGDGFSGALGYGSLNNREQPGLVDQTGVLAGKRVVSIGATSNHTVVLCSDGTLASWGANNSVSHVGDGTTTKRSSPVLVSTSGALAGKTPVALSVGSNGTTIVLCSDGTLVGWGYNNSYELLQGDRTARTSPVALNITGSPLEGRTVASFGVGGNGVTVLCTDGTLVSWGAGLYGALGTGSENVTQTPTLVNVGPGSALENKTAKSLSVGDAEVLVLCTDSTLVSWGLWSGDGVDNTRRLLPTLVSTTTALAGKTVVKIGCHANDKAVFCSDGTLAVWGGNYYGELSVGSTSNVLAPVAAITTIGTDEAFTAQTVDSAGGNLFYIVSTIGVPDISAEPAIGAAFIDGASTLNLGSTEAGVPSTQSFTVTNTGSAPLTITGITKSGTHAAQFTVASASFPIVLPKLSSSNIAVTFTPVGTGARTAALQITSNDADEAIFDLNLSGTGIALNTAPVVANYVTGNEVPVSAPRFTAAGRTLNVTLGHLPVIGRNFTVVENTGLEQINGTFAGLAHGQRVPLTFGGVTYYYVADYYGGSGNNDLVLVWASNRIYTWGPQFQLGRFGNTGKPGAVTSVQQLFGRTVLKLSAGREHVLALCSDGALITVGISGYGANGSIYSQNDPLFFRVYEDGVLAGKRVIDVAAGEYYSLALCSDGTLVGWGREFDGELGNGGSLSNISGLPGLVDMSGALAGKKVVAISAGFEMNMALCSDGTVCTWGDNLLGQLGDGTSTSRPSPVAVLRIGALAGKRVKQIVGGYQVCYALCTDNTLVSWGTGYLGRGISNDSSRIPVLVNTGAGSALQGRTAVSISAGTAGPSVLCSDGSLVTWGFNVGDDTSNTVLNPVLVDTTPASALNGKTITDHMASGNARFAISSDGSLVGWGNNLGADDGFRVGDNTDTNRFLPVAVDASALLPTERFVWFGNAMRSYSSMAVVAGPAVGEIEVFDVGQNQILPDDSNTDFGNVILNTAATKTFAIRNIGVGQLTGITLAIDGLAADDYDIIVPPAGLVLPGESTTFTVQFKPSNFDGENAYLHISSNDLDENPYDIQFRGEGYGEPRVTFYDADENELNSNSTFTFGDAATNTPRLRTFILENSGELPLTGIAVTFPTGPPGIYSLATAPPTSLAPGAKTDIVVAFAPTAVGASNGTMSIASNDGNSPFGLAFTGNGILPTLPEIDVINTTGGDVSLTDNVGTIALGDAVLGIGRTHTFSIRNTGTAPLTGLVLSKTGTNAADVLFSTLEKTTLAFQESMEFTVTFLPGGVGARAATVRIASNDANENPFDIALTANGTTPELNAEIPAGTALADGGAINYGTTAAVGSDYTRSVTLKNVGTATVNIADIVIDGVNADDFDYDLSGYSIAPGASRTLDIYFYPSTFGVRTAALHIVNNDSNESPYDIKLTGTAVGPEISVEQPAATVLVDGRSTVNFGPAVQPAFVSRTFTLKNPGTATLTGITASIVGADFENFSVTTAPPPTLAAKGTATLVVRFTPSAINTFNSTLRIVSNDYDENPFDITILGEGVLTLNPSFDVHPVSQIVALGAPATFSSVVDSPTAATSQWQKGTTIFANIAAATTTSYTLPAVKLTDAAVRYRMKATNPAGSTDSNPAALTVVDRTAKSFNLASAAPKATFTVSAATTPGSTLTYLWLKDGEALPVDARYVVLPASPQQLVINTLVPADAATYTCQVTGPGGTLAGGDNVLTIFDSAPSILPKPVVMDEGIVSGEYSFFIPLDENEGTPTSFTATPLPPGLKFNTVTGEFTGKPTTTKISPPYTINISAINTLGTSTATATLIVRPLTPGADGAYTGIIDRSPVNDNLGGRFTLNVTTTGSYTGGILLGSRPHIFPAGSITATAGSSLVTGSLSITRAPLPALAVTFTIDTNTKRITTGSVSSVGIGSSNFTGWKNVWNATTQATDYDDYYTFSLDVLSGSYSIPQGLSFGSFKVPLKGELFTIAGRTSDGDTFTSSTFLGPDGDLAIYDDLPFKGSLVGILDIVPGTGPAFNDNTLTGSPSWSRPENTAATASTYKDGFGPITLAVTGGRYVAPLATAIVLGKPTPAVANNAGLAFFDANIEDSAILADRRVSLIPGSSLTIAAFGPAQTTLKITTATGAISGGFTLVDTHPVTPGVPKITRKPLYQGIIVRTPTGLKGHGFYLLQQLPEPIFPQPAVLQILSGGVILE